MRHAVFFESLWRDLRYALRSMRQNAGFTATAVMTLALGIGGNTAIFTIIRGTLLKPLEYRNPDRLVYFSMADAKRNVENAQFSQQRFEAMQAARSFEGLGAYGANAENVTLAGGAEPEALKGARVSANFLEILGVRPVAGRSFRREEDTPGGAPVVMISFELWQRRFGGDAGIAGKAAMLDAVPHTIIGVLPQGFAFPFAGADVWFTRPAEWSLLAPRYWAGAPLLRGFGRLKPEASLEQGRAELEGLSQQYSAAHPGIDSGSIRAVRLKDRLMQNVSLMLWVLFGAVGFVLLIACANVASLLLARGTSRGRELALRAALGAGRGRLVRQLLAESLVLAVGGGALGAWIAEWGLAAVRNGNAWNLPGAATIRMDGMVLGFTLVLSVATGVLFGLFPSLEVTRPDLAAVLRESGALAGRGTGRGMLGVNPRALFVVGQVALSIVLLIGAALLMESFVRLRSVSPGFEPANLLTMRVALPPARYNSAQKRAAFFAELVERVAAVPGVREAAAAMSLPTTTWIRTNINRVQSQPTPDERDAASYAVVQSISPGYFRTLGIRVVRGREFGARDDTASAPPVIVINESLARRIWREYPRGLDPIGQHIGEAYDKAVGWMEVVGIVADIHEGGLAAEPTPEFYIPLAMHPPQTAYLAVRTQGEPLRFANSIRVQVGEMDRDQAVSDIRTMEAMFQTTLGQRRVTMVLLGSFAGVALLLTVVGIYGVIAYSVTQRTQEMGIRRALGAQRGDILRLVLGQVLGMAGGGVVLGIVGALALTRVVKGFLFHISPTDPATYAGIAGLLVLVAVAASVIPAARAVRIDPMRALRVG